MSGLIIQLLRLDGNKYLRRAMIIPASPESRIKADAGSGMAIASAVPELPGMAPPIQMGPEAPLKYSIAGSVPAIAPGTNTQAIPPQTLAATDSLRMRGRRMRVG